MTPQIPPPGMATPAGPDVWTQLMQGLSNLASNPAAPLIIAISHIRLSDSGLASERKEGVKVWGR